MEVVQSLRGMECPSWVLIPDSYWPSSYYYRRHSCPTDTESKFTAEEAFDLRIGETSATDRLKSVPKLLECLAVVVGGTRDKMIGLDLSSFSRPSREEAS